MYLLVCIYQAGMAEPGVAPPIFGRSVNPIPTSGADYAHHITTCRLCSIVATQKFLFAKFMSVLDQGPN